MSTAQPSNTNDMLGPALFLAIGVHALVILGVSFQFEPPAPATRSRESLEIVVLRNPHQSEPVEKPDFLAQTSQRGGGDRLNKTRPRTPAPEVPVAPLRHRSQPGPRTPAVTSPARESPRRVITAKTAPRKVVTASRRTPRKKNRPTTAEILASSNQEIARITAELDRRAEAYAQRPRRRHISASTQEYKYAAYLDAWRKKIERIGNLNYPEEAKRRKLHGNLVLHVAIRADGTVERINIRKSSGYNILDDAAIRIVRLAAPFAPFPKEIRAETDILDITRTWQFLDSNRLGWK